MGSTVCELLTKDFGGAAESVRNGIKAPRRLEKLRADCFAAMMNNQIAMGPAVIAHSPFALIVVLRLIPSSIHFFVAVAIHALLQVGPPVWYSEFWATEVSRCTGHSSAATFQLLRKPQLGPSCTLQPTSLSRVKCHCRLFGNADSTVSRASIPLAERK